MFITVSSAAITGLQASLVTVEVDISPGWPGFQIVGLPDTSIQEAKERIRVAWKNSGFIWPHGKGVTVNLAPASVRKEGAWFDLPMAIGMCALEFGLPETALSKTLIVGELALDGGVRGSKGVLPVVRFAAAQGYKQILVATENAVEAALVTGLKIIPISSLKVAVAYLKNLCSIKPVSKVELKQSTPKVKVDFADIVGQELAKRGLEIAAAGGHNVLFTGPPGSGKTLLAQALPGILPPMTAEENLEVGTIYSIVGQLGVDQGGWSSRPFRSPHHSASVVAIVGGGQQPRPGEITLAHRGVLFLDELPEFTQTTLEALRQPMEDGRVAITRAQYSVEFPAKFMLVASQNPCPCGYLNDQSRSCTCSPVAIANYQKKISGPLLDRIDMRIQVPRLDWSKLEKVALSEKSIQIRQRVVSAFERQINRQGVCNSELPLSKIRTWYPLAPEVEEILARAHARFQLTGRGVVRVLRLARTAADLVGADTIRAEHVSEALLFRCGAY